MSHIGLSDLSDFLQLTRAKVAVEIEKTRKCRLSGASAIFGWMSGQKSDKSDSPTHREGGGMSEIHRDTIPESPTHGCMACKAQRPYTVEPFANGNTGWRCTVCGTMLHLIPGTYLS